jgi:hypothetical protein
VNRTFIYQQNQTEKVKQELDSRNVSEACATGKHGLTKVNKPNNRWRKEKRKLPGFIARLPHC